MFTRFDIVTLIPGMAIDPGTLDTRSLGGSESSGLYMARALAAEGASVRVFCNTATTWSDRGVDYLPTSAWPAFSRHRPHDVCIVQRLPDAFAQRTNARLNVLWCHDLALGRQENAFRSALWNIDCTVALSQFMKDQYKEVYKLDDDAIYLSRNGIDLDLFRALRQLGIPRDRKKLIYAGRPERGLDLLLGQVMPALLAAD